MPLGLVFRERNALALDCVGDEASRLPRLKRQRGQAHVKRRMIVTVDLFAGKSEGTPFLGQRVHTNCVFGEVTLLNLAVPGQDKGSPALPVYLCGERATDGDRKPMPERAGVGFHAREFVPVWGPVRF